MNTNQVVPNHNQADRAASDADALATERQAAHFLGVTTRALQKWRVTGTGPRFVRISGRCIRYRRRDLLVWIEARLKSSTADD